MPIIGFNFEKIVAEKKKPITSEVRIKPDISINEVKEEEINLESKKETVLKIDFEFSAKYQPGFGEIKLNGNLIFLETPKEIKKAMDAWKKEKKLPQSIMAYLLNTILLKCNIRALSLSQEVNLPPHIRLPIVKPRVDVNDYIG